MSLRMRLFALILVSSSVLLARSETQITVVVTDQFNKPVPSASVILDFLGSRQIVKLGKHKKMDWELHTNLEGIAHFPPVPRGTVQVQVIDPHHQTFGKRFFIKTPEETINVQLKPPQKQYTVNPGPKQK
ncbi:MAG: hypothetical protein ACRD4O_02190 [Bryobacteraceae bacterium]